MKLNYDCVREVLLYIEENLQYGQILYSSDIELENYEYEDVQYTIDLLADSAYIKANKLQVLGPTLPSFHIYSLTMQGHELLDNIRDNSVWKKIKKKISGLASVSLPIINSLGSTIIKEILFQ
ncbi:MAG: DUF2513 domain-containing protein [Eubacterium sp.]|nr:DUF2513 domain-containing protein [Eubacterium sp.]MDE6752741.1 DUF2513 domain-containing protein [Eubacterium sp.]